MHRYPDYAGAPQFREAAANYMRRRFGVKLDWPTQVFALIGSKEGIAHLPLAFINPGDVTLVPSPGYPVYNIGTIFAGGQSHFMPLLRQNGFLPDLDAIPRDVLAKAKILYVNYPNNPTAACADLSFFEKVVAFAHEHGLLVAHDAAYVEMGFDGFRPSSILEADGAMDVAIEFHSLSKTFNMTGWRIGFVCGNAAAAQGLGRIKTNVDSGAFTAIQRAAVEALTGDWTCVQKNMDIYRQRRDVAVAGLTDLGFSVETPKASFYIWFSVPEGMTSKQFCAGVLEKAGVVITPGNGFGAGGEGFARMALTVPKERVAEAIQRIGAVKL
jgi:LL-diaminopimelate aminotransferase